MPVVLDEDVIQIAEATHLCHITVIVEQQIALIILIVLTTLSRNEVLTRFPHTGEAGQRLVGEYVGVAISAIAFYTVDAVVARYFSATSAYSCAICCKLGDAQLIRKVLLANLRLLWIDFA